MKVNRYILVSLAVLGFSSCESDFLDRAPLTEVTENDYFNTVTDLETYTNGFYGYIGPSYNDPGTDNEAINTGGSTTNQVVAGNISSANVSGWDKSTWGNLRSINYFLEHTGKVSGNAEDINHYIGIARFFRARFYADKVKNYSDVPWYSKTLAADDQDMYKACDPRALVMDSVLADMQYSVDHIKEEIGTRTRISRWAALASMARICLYEGTYRKYHAELNLQNDYQRFLEKAVWACEEVMNSGEFSLYGSSGADYGTLFNTPSLDGNSEIILQQAADQGLGVGNNSHCVLGWQWALSRSLMESYLMQDGSRFTDQPDYDKKTYKEIFENRDPRLKETFVYPGFKQTEAGQPYLAKITFGGYDQLKFYPRDETLRQGWNMNYTSLPIFRYAEVLLTYAEAKAELGELTQEDVDKSINLIRKRVQMPSLNMAEANAKPDPWLAEQYPNVSGENKGVILEIRRERRVETACEGLRWSDIQRWAVGDLYAVNNEGMYISQLGAFDVTGDNVVDIAILASPDDESPIASLPEDIKTNLSRYYLKKADGTDDGFYLTEGTKGHIGFTSYIQVPRHFESPKYYYLPIPQSQINLNPNLKQPFGWE